MGTRLSLDDPRLRKAAELYRSGQSVHQIAPQVGVTSMAVHGWLKFMGVPRRSSAEATRSRYSELRSLNEYEVRGEATVLFAKTKTGERVEILVDTADLPRLKEHGRRWWAVKRPHTSYAKTQAVSGEGAPHIYLHQFIMGGSSRETHVDHINHNGLDNRRANLRLVSRTINFLNRAGPVKGSKSGLRGVHWNKQKGKWSARVARDGKTAYLGSFEDKHEAAEAVEAKLREWGVKPG